MVACGFKSSARAGGGGRGLQRYDGSNLHCTVLRCTALHSIALDWTALDSIALHCTALHCTALHYEMPPNRDAMGLFLDALSVASFSFDTGCGRFAYKSGPECYTRACSMLQPKATVAPAPISNGRE